MSHRRVLHVRTCPLRDEINALCVRAGKSKDPLSSIKELGLEKEEVKASNSQDMVAFYKRKLEEAEAKLASEEEEGHLKKRPKTGGN